MSKAASILLDRLVPEKVAEELIGLSRGTLAVKRCRKTLPFPYLRMGRQIRYRESDLNAYLASVTIAPKATTI